MTDMKPTGVAYKKPECCGEMNQCGGECSNRITVPDSNGSGLPDGLCPEVIAFAHAMQHKLTVNKHKGGDGWPRDEDGARKGWKPADLSFLMNKLDEEVRELKYAVLMPQSAVEIRNEAADVGNIAMMLADNCDALNAAPQPDQGATNAAGEPKLKDDIYILYFDDTDRNYQIFTTSEHANKAFLMSCGQWSCHLFKRIKSSLADDYYGGKRLQSDLGGYDLAGDPGGVKL